MTDDETCLRNVVAQWHAATNAGDVDALPALMTEDVTFLVAGQPPMRGRDAFVQALKPLLVTHRIESTGAIQEIEVSGDLAWCRSELDVRVVARDGNTVMRRAGSVLSIFRRSPDGWQLARDANLLTLQKDA
ncbi:MULTISPECIES: SgcJ/EcaC family oxidoreductase [unclassified Paraburkholderia]|uniref:YybH family protein n=1 Tax=unclassified Paraburkholderia TaxID=2615204 RepID=UPI002AAF92DA|nr:MULTISPECIES: SgcJ/EcaC family oxidoreductase [unclassified Paraburkholderia]